MKGQRELRIIFKPKNRFYVVEGDRYAELSVDEAIAFAAQWCVNLFGWKGHRMSTAKEEKEWRRRLVGRCREVQISE